MINKKSFAALCALSAVFIFTLASAAFALSPQEFSYSVELRGNSSANGIYMSKISPAMVENSLPGFLDLRVYAPNTTEIPYIIVDNRLPAEYIDNYYSLTIADYSENTDSVSLTATMPDKRQPIEIIELETGARDFKKNVTIYASDDKINWIEVLNEPYFDFSSKVDFRKTSFKFQQKLNNKYYKFVMYDASVSLKTGKSISLKYEGLDFSTEEFAERKVKIDRISAKTGFNVKKDATTTYCEKIFDKLNVIKDKNNNSIIDINARIPFDRITFDISSLYYNRAVRVFASDTGAEDSYSQLASFTLYNYPDSEFRASRNELWFSSIKRNYYRFVIENKNNPALEIRKIKLEFVEKNILFTASGDISKYAVHFGNKKAVAPQYDISSFINQSNWYKLKYEILSTGDISANESYVEKKTPVSMRPELEKALLTVIVLIVVLALGYWLYNLMAAIPPAGGNGDSKGE